MAQFSEYYQGISRSRSDQGGFDNIVNGDVHSEVGYFQPQLALAVDSSSSVPTQACVMAKSPTGVTYSFTTGGLIYSLSVAGTWTYLGSIGIGIIGARYYNGYIWYATTTNLYRFTDGNFGTNAHFSAFSNTSSYRPMEEVNLTLFIGNGKDTASVNSNSTFNNSALDLPPNYTITTLAGVGVELLIGTVIGTYVNNCKVFSWDTSSDSWTIEDEVPERGVNCFIKSDDVVFAQCGTEGQLYYWNGSTMIRFKKIRGITTTVAPYNWTIRNGRCLFAAGQKIFSLHKEDNDLPNVIVQEYTTITGNVNSLNSVGGTLYVSTGTTINKTGTTYATAYIDTPEVSGSAQNVIVQYDSLPTGTSIGISVNKDGGGYVAIVPKTDTIRKKIYFDGKVGQVNFIQARVTLTSSGASRPKIRLIEIK